MKNSTVRWLALSLPFTTLGVALLVALLIPVAIVFSGVIIFNPELGKKMTGNIRDRSIRAGIKTMTSRMAA